MVLEFVSYIFENSTKSMEKNIVRSKFFSKIAKDLKVAP